MATAEERGRRALNEYLRRTQIDLPSPSRGYDPEAVGLPEEQRQLLRTQRTVAQLGQRAQQLGLEDVQGTGPTGFLTGALNVLSRPQSAVLGFLTGATGVGIEEGEEENPFVRALLGLSGREQYRGSDIIGPAAEDAGVPERILRGTAGFGIDVLTDPLTYLTFGSGGALRGAARAAATEADVLRSARTVLPTVTRTAPETPVALGTATQASQEAAQRQVGAILGQPGTVMTPAQPVSTITRPTVSAPQALAQGPAFTPPGAPDLAQQVAEAAAAGQAARGSRGVRERIQETLAQQEQFAPEESARLASEIFAGLRPEVRGGVGLGIPFGATRVPLTPGGGILTDKLGLTKYAERVRGLTNAYRSTSMYRALQDLVGGRYGAEYADFVRTEITGKGGMTYQAFKGLTKADRRRTALLAEKSEELGNLTQFLQDKLDKAADPELAKAAAVRFAQTPTELIEPPLNATPDELAGFAVASTVRNLQRGLRDERNLEAARAGVSVKADNADTVYIGRPITKEYREYRKSLGKKTGGYTPDQKRVVQLDTDEFGKLRSATPEELNIRARQEWGVPENINVYETDPLRVFAHQAAYYVEEIAEYRLIADLKAALPLVTPEFGVLRTLGTEAFSQRATRAEQELINILDRLSTAKSQATTDAQKSRIENAINKLTEDPATISALMLDIRAGVPEEVNRVGSLVAIMKRAYEEAGKAGIPIDKETRKLLTSKAGLIDERVTVTNAQQLAEMGLGRITGSARVRIPEAFSDKWAPEAIKDAVEKTFRIERGADNKYVRGFVDSVYQPYYVGFKTLATVGRPGGYHIRNLIGGWWNNYLGDVAVGDHSLAMKLIQADLDSKAKARKAIQNVLDGKPSGLSGDDNIVAKLAAEVTRRGSASIEMEAADLADYLLIKELDNIKIGEFTAKQIVDSFDQQGLVRSARRLERLREEARSGIELADAIRDPNYQNLFRGVGRDELNKVQQGLNAVINFKPVRLSADAADFQERYIRLAAFISGTRRFGLEDGGEAAGYLTKALQFDYQDLSEFERRVLKNIIPFYVWTRRNIPLQFSSLIYQPGKFNQLGFAQEEAESYFGAEGDTDNMLNVLPEWARERMGFVSRYKFRGSPLSFMVESPAIDLNRYLSFTGVKPSAGRIGREVISASNPLLKASIEGITGYDTFTGGKISEKGELSPFGNIPVPGITFTGPEGEQRISSRGYGIVKDLFPTLGLISRVSGRGGDADRQLTSVLSSFLGAPVGTLTPRQSVAELKAREDRLRKQIQKTAINLGADEDWLKTQLDAGANAEDIRDALAAGYGRRPSSAE